MSTLEATVSMLESMPEEARIRVFQYVQELFTSQRPANPFVPLGEAQIMADLTESREQIKNGQGINMKEALTDMGAQYGYL